MQRCFVVNVFKTLKKESLFSLQQQNLLSNSRKKVIIIKTMPIKKLHCEHKDKKKLFGTSESNFLWDNRFLFGFFLIK